MARTGFTGTAGSNSITAKRFVEQDGSGDLKEFDGTGVPKGFSQVGTSNNNTDVDVVTNDVIKVASSSLNPTYNVGDVLDATTTGVQQQSSGTSIGIAAESGSFTSGAELTMVLDLDLA